MITFSSICTVKNSLLVIDRPTDIAMYRAAIAAKKIFGQLPVYIYDHLLSLCTLKNALSVTDRQTDRPTLPCIELLSQLKIKKMRITKALKKMFKKHKSIQNDKKNRVQMKQKLTKRIE